MTNRIPPLHPASPPPMCKLDFSEDELEENDDFGDFSTAVPEFTNSHESSGVVIDAERSNTATPDHGISLPELDDSIKASENSINGLDAACIKVGQPNEIARDTDGCGQSSSLSDTTIDDVPDLHPSFSQSSNVISSSSINNTLAYFSSAVTDDILTIPATTFPIEDDKYPDSNDEKSAVDDYEIVDETYMRDVASELDVTEDSILALRTTTNADTTLAESSDEDSETVINESAFVVEGSSNERDSDSINDFADYRTEIPRENAHSMTESLCLGQLTFGEFDNSQSCQQTASPVGQNDDELFSSMFVDRACSVQSVNETVTTSPMSFDFVDVSEPDVQTNWNNSVVTTDCERLSNSMDVEALSKPEDGVSKDDDDDFSEFVSPTDYTCSKANEFSHSNQDPVQPNVVDDLEFDAFSSSTYAEVCDSFDPSGDKWNDIFQFIGEDPIEVNVNSIESKLNGSSVWCRMKNVETSPALNYNWNDSEANKMLLSTLCVDSRNILFGPRWNSEVPRFASNLGFSPLVPQKASSSNDTPNILLPAVTPVAEPEPQPLPSIAEPCPRVPATVPDAHFDWNNSGLTNPLDACKSEKVKETEISQLDYDVAVGGDVSRGGKISLEASRILSNLPNLLVMEKQYIVFPIR